MSIADIRTEYKLATLSEDEVAINPIEQFARWWEEAINSEIPEVNAMTLSTASKLGRPSSRIVLLKGYDEQGFVFFTNYESRKGQDIAENPNVSLLFFWKELERQIRIDGTVTKVTVEESDEYFASRPKGSKIGAWASPQSQVIATRHLLEKRSAGYEMEFKGDDIPRPEHWGGYRVKPFRIEFWQGRENRLHDRIQYEWQSKGWIRSRLAP
ncbi:MAG: pyridoxamine 5'-phosphate oxidase [Chitinophagaceae bacterium]